MGIVNISRVSDRLKPILWRLRPHTIGNPICYQRSSSGRCVTGVDYLLNREDFRRFISQSIHTCETPSTAVSAIFVGMWKFFLYAYCVYPTMVTGNCCWNVANSDRWCDRSCWRGTVATLVVSGCDSQCGRRVLSMSQSLHPTK